VGGLQNILGALGVSVGIGAMIGLIKSSMALADELGKLNDKMGGTEEATAGIALAFKMAGIDIGKLGPSLGVFSKNIHDFENGTGKAAKALGELGLKSGDFKGKDLAQSLVLVASKLGPLEAGWDKNAKAMDIFSKKGLAMIPAMNALAKSGMGPFVAALDRMFDQRAIRSAEMLNDEFEKMGVLTQGLGIKFLEGFAPAAMQATSEVEAKIDDLADSAYRAGQAVGLFFKILAAPFITVGAWLAGEAAKATVILTTLADVIQTLFGPGSALGKAHLISVRLVTGARQVAQIIVDEAETMGNAWATIVKPPPALVFDTKGSGKAGDGGGAGVPDYALAKAQRQSDLSAERDAVNEVEALWDQAYRRGQVSLDAYYKQKATLRAEDLQAQLAAIEREKLEPDSKGQPKPQSDIIALDEKARHLKAEWRKAENLAIEDQHEKQVALDKDIASVEAAAFQRTADGYAAEDDLIDAKAEKYRAMLVQRGDQEMAVASKVAAYKEALETQAAARKTIAAAEGEFDTYNAQAAAIQEARSAGVMSEVEAKYRLLALEKQELPILQAAAAAAVAAAAASNDPALQAKAASLTAQVVSVTNAIAAMEDVALRVKVKLQDALVTGLTEFFTTGIQGSQTFLQAFLAMASGVVAAIQQMLAQMLAMAIVKAMFGLAGGGCVSSSGKPATQGQVDHLAADGGPIVGPGGPTSDSIPAWLSNGEFVIRAAVASRPGVRGMLSRLNSGLAVPGLRGSQGPHRFADGGLVAASGTESGQAALSANLTIGLEDGLVLRQLKSPEGQKTLLNVVSKNRRAFTAAFGG
jgi:hypothetical protein